MKIEDEVDALVAEAIDRLKVLTDEVYVREGVAKLFLREFVWAAIGAKGLAAPKDVVADHLEVMAELVREDSDDLSGDRARLSGPPKVYNAS